MFINRFMKFPGLFYDANGGGGIASEEVGEEKKEEAKPITFKSQEELDAQFKARAAQGKRSGLEELFKGLGVKDETELKVFFEEGKKLKDGQLTEIEKAATEKQAAEDALKAEKELHTQTRTIYTERLLKSEVKGEAKKAGFRDESLDDVWLLVKANYREKITEQDDMFVGVEKAIEEIKKNRAYWLSESSESKTKTPGSPKPGKKSGDGQPTPQTQRPISRL